MTNRSSLARLDLVIFDMDDVLAHLDRERRLGYLAELTGLEPEFLQAAIWDSDFERAAEQGAYPTGEEYLAEFNRRIASDVSRREWITARQQAMSIDEETLRIAASVREFVPIAMLTNNGSLLKESLPEMVPPIAQLFGTRAHASYEFGARKPDPLVFQRLLKCYDVAPEHAIFIDDTPDCVAGAERAGLYGIHFTGAQQLAAELRMLGTDVLR